MHLRVTAVLTSVVAAAALALAGCSSADDTAACNKILQEIQGVGSGASGSTGDTGALGKVYIDAAANIRTAANDASDEVKTAASNLAASMEEVGNSLNNLDSTNPKIPDTTAFAAAGSKMQDACN